MAIVTQDLSFVAGGRTILSGATLAFSDGCISAILGPSGSGKSTLLKCLVTAQRPSGGGIRVNGRDVQAIGDEPAGLTCRVYRLRDGRYSPLPDREDLRDALTVATHTATEGTNP